MLKGLLVAVTLATTTVIPFAVDAGAGSTPTAVYVYGDGLTFQARDALLFQMGLEGVHATVEDYPGSALCDWVPAIEQQVEVARPALVAVQFSGDADTPCMTGVNTVAGIVARYQVWLDYLAGWLHSKGVPLAVVGTPPGIEPNGQPIVIPATWTVGELPGGYQSSATTLDNMYQAQVAQYGAMGWHASYIDAGSAVASPGWTYVLPCMSFETASMGCADGLIEVRAPDFRHFCPDPIQGGCGVWDSGGWRYAAAITAFILRTVP
jgi:hypothetical protein